MKNSIFLFLMFALISACKTDVSTDILVKTNSKYGNLFGSRTSPLSFMKSTPQDLKGIIKLDTFYIQHYLFYNNNDLKKLNAERLKFNIQNKKFITGIYVLTGFINNKQILVVDANQNLDFSDDKKIIFTKQLSYNISQNYKIARDSFPLVQVTYNSVEANHIINKKLFIRPYPVLNYFYTPEPSAKFKLQNKLRIAFGTNRYNYGEFNVNQTHYKVAFKSRFNQYIFRFQTKDKAFLNISDAGYKKYRLKDTVSFSKVFYRIDSVNFNESKLFLKKLNIHAKIFGYQIGEIISGFKLNDIRSGDSLTLNKLLADKKYVLLDFWGTWCAPCKELTPDLVQFKTQHQTDVSVLSIAFQKDKNSLLKYIAEHKMDWNHALIKGYAKSRSEKPNLIKNLAIESYPTFILVDKNKKIIFRGTGKPALMKIKQILKKTP